MRQKCLVVFVQGIVTPTQVLREQGEKTQPSSLSIDFTIYYVLPYLAKMRKVSEVFSQLLVALATQIAQ